MFGDNDTNVNKQRWYDHFFLLLPAAALIRMILTILMITAVAGKGCAQETLKDTVVTWDLETCLRYAKEHNIALKRRVLDKRTSDQDLILARAARWPDLYFSATRFVDHGNTALIGESGWSGEGDSGMSSTWTLFRGGYMSNDIRQKGLQVESAKLTIMQQENDLTLQIIQQYLNTLLDKESITYARTLTGTSAAQVDQARLKLAAGSIAKKELMQLEAQLANDRYLLITSENAQQQDLINLKQLLQLPVSTRLDIVVIDPSPLLTIPESITTVQQEAFQNRPEIRNASLGIAIADAGLAKAKAGYWPTISLSGSVGSRYFGSSTTAPRQVQDDFSQQVSVNISVPIFTRKLNSVNVAKARIGREQAQLGLTETKTTLLLIIERAYYNLISAKNQFKAAASAFNYNNEAYRVAVDQLRTGLINMVEFLQQKTLYLQAQQRYLQAKYTAGLTQRIYEFYKQSGQ